MASAAGPQVLRRRMAGNRTGVAVSVVSAFPCRFLTRRAWPRIAEESGDATGQIQASLGQFLASRVRVTPTATTIQSPTGRPCGRRPGTGVGSTGAGPVGIRAQLPSLFAGRLWRPTRHVLRYACVRAGRLIQLPVHVSEQQSLLRPRVLAGVLPGLLRPGV